MERMDPKKKRPRAQKKASSKSEDPPRQRLQIFVPEGVRAEKTIPVDLQDKATVELLEFCAKAFRGATAYGRGVGAWRDGDAEEAPILWDRVTVVEVLVDPLDPNRDQKLEELGKRLSALCDFLNQKEIGSTLDGRWKSYYRQEAKP